MHKRKNMVQWGCRIFLVLFCLFCFLGRSQTGKAASAQMSMQLNRSVIEQGDRFYVLVTITSTDEMSGFEGKISYDQGTMKYISGGSVASGNDDYFVIKDLDRKKGTKQLKYSIQFKGRKEGKCKLVLKSGYGVYRFEDGQKMSLGYDTLFVNVLSQDAAQDLEKGEEPPTEATAVPTSKENLSNGLDEKKEEAAEKSTQTDLDQRDSSHDGNQENVNDKKKEEQAESPLHKGNSEVIDEKAQATSERLENADLDVGFRGPGRNICIAIIVIASVLLMIVSYQIMRDIRRVQGNQEYELYEEKEATEEESDQEWFEEERLDQKVNLNEEPEEERFGQRWDFDEEPEEERFGQRWDFDEEPEEENVDQGIDLDDYPEKEDIDLSEIEKRLEEKRKWLNKN